MIETETVAPAVTVTPVAMPRNWTAPSLSKTWATMVRSLPAGMPPMVPVHCPPEAVNEAKIGGEMPVPEIDTVTLASAGCEANETSVWMAPVVGRDGALDPQAKSAHIAAAVP